MLSILSFHYEIVKAKYLSLIGADFIKTSTGKEEVNAVLPVAFVMVRAIRDYHTKTGVKVGNLTNRVILP